MADNTGLFGDGMMGGYGNNITAANIIRSRVKQPLYQAAMENADTGSIRATPPTPFESWLNESGQRLMNPTDTIAQGVQNFTQQDPVDMGMSLLNGGMGGALGATVWHGSPHKFAKFDSSKMGTGATGQYFGPGSYVADSPSVASNYMGAQGPVMDNSFIHTIDGVTVPNPSQTLKNVIRSGGAENFIKQMQGTLDRKVGALSKASKIDEMGLGLSDYDLAKMDLQDTQKIIDEANSYLGKKLDYKKTGNLYKVDLPDEHITKMLDWDKPASQQEVLKNFQHSNSSRKWFATEDPTGEMIYRNMDRGEIPAHESLQRMGIPGIKYIETGDNGVGKGSSNYVVFPGNEDMLTILERNNQPLVNALRKPTAGELAQKIAHDRAMLPVSEHGLGLPAGNTAMDRAKAMEFNTPTYHGTGGDFSEFDPNRTKIVQGSFSTTDPTEASSYAEGILAKQQSRNTDIGSANVMPLLLNTTEYRKMKPYGWNLNNIESARDAGMKGAISQSPAGVLDTHLSFDPSTIRSRFAAFDPWRRNAAIAVLTGTAAPDLMAGENDNLVNALRSK